MFFKYRKFFLIFFFFLINCGGGSTNTSVINNINNEKIDNDDISSELDTSLNEIFSLFNELGL